MDKDYQGQGGIGEAYATMHAMDKKIADAKPKSKEMLKAEWDMFPRFADSLNKTIVDEISSEVFLKAGISLDEAERLGDVLIEICRADFLKLSNVAFELLKSENAAPMIPKPTAGGVNLAQVTLNDLFKPTD